MLTFPNSGSGEIAQLVLLCLNGILWLNANAPFTGGFEVSQRGLRRCTGPDLQAAPPQPHRSSPLQCVVDHPWVRANSRRVLPPICPTKKSWAHLACLPHTEGCLIIPLHRTLWPAFFTFFAMGFKLPLFWLFLQCKCTPNFYIVQCDVIIYVSYVV